MPLPGSLTGVPPEVQGRLGPYCDANGNYYTVLEEFLADGNNPIMLKSTDGGQTWAEVDAAGAPEGSSVNDLESGWLIQAGTVLIFVWTDDTLIYYCTFNTSDAATNPDTWQIKAETAHTLSATSGSRANASVARLSDGRVRVVFQDALVSTRNQLAVITKSTTTGAGGWSAKTRLSVDADNFGGTICVRGASDTLHIFSHDIANRTILHRTLTSSDVLSANTRRDTAGTDTASANWHAMSNAVYYDNAGTECIAVLYISVTDRLRLLQSVGGTWTDTEISTAAIAMAPDGSSGATGADAPHCHLAVDGTTLLMQWVDNATGDLMHATKAHGAAPSAPSTLWASGTNAVFWNYCNVYTRGGNVLYGYLYDIGPHIDDGGAFRYNEYVIRAVSSGVDKLFLGASMVDDLKVGSSSVSAVYLGSDLVWQP